MATKHIDSVTSYLKKVIRYFSADAGHSTEAVFDLSLGIVIAGYAFEAYKDPVRHYFCSLRSVSYDVRLSFTDDDAP